MYYSNQFIEWSSRHFFYALHILFDKYEVHSFGVSGLDNWYHNQLTVFHLTIYLRDIVHINK